MVKTTQQASASLSADKQELRVQRVKIQANVVSIDFLDFDKKHALLQGSIGGAGALPRQEG